MSVTDQITMAQQSRETPRAWTMRTRAWKTEMSIAHLLRTAAFFLGVVCAAQGQTQERPAERPQHPGPERIDREEFLASVHAMGLGQLCCVDEIRWGLLQAWGDQYTTLRLQLAGKDALPAGAAGQVFDSHTLCRPEDQDPLGVVLRRGRALLDHLAERHPRLDLADYVDAWRRLGEAADSAAGDVSRRRALYFVACAVRRQIAFRNPLLDFERILFVARGNDTRDLWSNNGLGGGLHFVTAYCAFASLPGGSIYTVENFKSKPIVKDQIRNRTIGGGSFDGRTIDRGVTMSPELSFDASKLLFAWAPITRWEMRWDEDTVWHIYESKLDGDWATQLTSGPYNDFDPCYLPDGRIAFVSERRGGYARCFDATWPVRNFVLHGMNADGSETMPLSWFESAEWQPSLANDGRIVYCRWDYVDRDFGQGQNLWFCYPDGRDPRAPHGNYPSPHYVPPDADPQVVGDSRLGRPFCEFNIRAVPGSAKYVACAVPQHGLPFGALIMIDMLRAPDDGHMSQLRRLTPYQEFPETEGPAYSPVNPALWSTPWPLSEDFYLCNYLSDLVLLDRFGNLVVLCEKDLVPGWDRLLWTNRRQGDNGFRLLDPIPVKPRPVPPVIPRSTSQGELPAEDAVPATISITNVYDSDTPLPPGVKVKWLRIVQHLVKSNSQQDDPALGFGVNCSAKMSLGLVPVQEDGSVYCEAPVGKLLMFQLLDENYRAVHSMRSATYVHPGERLSCIGCHEHPTAPADQPRPPPARPRRPSRLEPDVCGVEPITYFRTVQPVFERGCIPCHTELQRGPRNMRFAFLKPYVWYYHGGATEDVVLPEIGGSRTMPGRFGSYACRMGLALMDEDHRGKVSLEDFRRVMLWLDNNSPLYGACHSTAAQDTGQLVWPKLDVDPQNPQGLERLWDAEGRLSLNRPAYLSVADFHRLRGTIGQMQERPDWSVTADRWDGGDGKPRGWKPRSWNEWQTGQVPLDKPQH